MEIPESIRLAWRMRCSILVYATHVEKKLQKIADYKSTPRNLVNDCRRNPLRFGEVVKGSCSFLR